MKVGRRRLGEFIIEWALWACAFFSVAVTVGIISALAVETVGFFREVSLISFLTDTQWTPLFQNKHFGIWPLLSGTLLTTGIAMAVALPLGFTSAAYISEYVGERWRRVIKPLLEILAAVPTVVYGYFALLFVTPLLQQFIPGLAGFNALSPGMVMGVMIMPTIASLTEDALHAVPVELKEAAYAVGSTRFQVLMRVTTPAALSGISAAAILGTARAVGETMIVAIAAGLQPRFTLNPLVPIETATAYIVQVSMGDTPAGTLEYKTIFAVGMSLFLLTFALNLVSFGLRRRFREVY